jgi:hypothetical protein
MLRGRSDCTVEFRYRHGTTEPAHIIAWAELCRGIVDYVMAGGKVGDGLTLAGMVGDRLADPRTHGMVPDECASEDGDEYEDGGLSCAV